MPPELRAAFKQELITIYDQHPPYKKDITIRPFDPIEVGVDCSRYMFLGLYEAARKAGIVGLGRVPAKDMAAGLAGWGNREVSHLAAQPGDLTFWIFKGQWHVGAVFEPWAEGRRVIHSSSSRRGPVIDRWEGALFRDLEHVKELTIGD